MILESWICKRWLEKPRKEEFCEETNFKKSIHMARRNISANSICSAMVDKWDTTRECVASLRKLKRIIPRKFSPAGKKRMINGGRDGVEWWAIKSVRCTRPVNTEAVRSCLHRTSSNLFMYTFQGWRIAYTIYGYWEKISCLTKLNCRVKLIIYIEIVYRSICQ